MDGFGTGTWNLERESSSTGSISGLQASLYSQQREIYIHGLYDSNARAVLQAFQRLFQLP